MFLILKGIEESFSHTMFFSFSLFPLTFRIVKLFPLLLILLILHACARPKWPTNWRIVWVKDTGNGTKRHAVLYGMLRGTRTMNKPFLYLVRLYILARHLTWKLWTLNRHLRCAAALSHSPSLSRLVRGQLWVHTLTLTSEICGKWRNFHVRCKFECRMHKTWRNVWLKNVNKWCGQSGKAGEKLSSHANPLENRHQVDS